MNTTEPVPRELKWLAVLWLVWAIGSLAPLLSLAAGSSTSSFRASLLDFSMRPGQFSFNANIGLLGFYIGPGLYYRKPLARTLALGVTWFFMLGALALAILTLFIPVWPMLVFFAVVLVPTLIQYDILVRPKVRRHFEPAVGVDQV